MQVQKIITCLVLSATPFFNSHVPVHAVNHNDVCTNDPSSNIYVAIDKIMVMAASNSNYSASRNDYLSNESLWRAQTKNFLPTFSLGIDYYYYDTPNYSKLYNQDQEVNTDVFVYYQYVSPYVSFSWDLLSFDNIYNERYYRNVSLASKELSIETGIDQALQASTILLGLSKQIYTYNVKESLRDIYNTIYLVSRDKMRAGLASQIDVNASLLEKLSYETELSIAKSSIQNEIQDLSRVLEDNDFCIIKPDSSDNIFIHGSNDILSMIDTALIEYPEYKRLESQYKSQQSLVSKYLYAYFPTLNTSGQIGPSYSSGSISGNSNEPDEFARVGTSYIALNLSWDFFDSYKNINLMNSAQYQSKSLQNKLNIYEFEFRSKLKSIAESLPHQKKAYNLALEKIDILDKQVEMVREGYISGYKTILDLKNTTNELLTTSLELTDLWSQIINSMILVESKTNFPTLYEMRSLIHSYN